MNQIRLKFFLPLLGILFIYFISRFQNIQSLPVFGDEAIYLRWSQIIRNVETLRFIPLTDGKQPLFMWVTAAAYKFISDPVLAGRLISIFSGAGIIIGLYIFSLIFLNLPVAIVSGLIYVLIPFTFFFDRMALADTMLSFFGITSLILAFCLAKYPRLDTAMLLGTSLGLAWLTKSPAMYFIILSWVTYIGFNHHNLKKLYFPLISTAIALIIYNILRLGPQFHQINLRNQDYIWPLQEIIKHPLDPLTPHLHDIIFLYGQYISYSLLILAVLGLIINRKKLLNPIYVLLLLWWSLPLIGNAAIAKVFTARYVLFTIPPLIILLGVGVTQFYQHTFVYFRSRILQLVVITLCFLPNIFWITRISLTPFNVVLSSTEFGYNAGWTSGWGIKEASQYLISRSKHANIIVGTEGYFGTLPDGLQIYTDSLPQLTVFGVGIDIHEVPAKLVDARQHGDEVYLLFNQSRLKLIPTELEKVTLVKNYPKPQGDALVLYQLK